MLKHIDKLDSLHLAHDGLYERQETRLVKRLVKPGQVFVDVGAHIGYYSVMASELVGLNGRVYCFEPNTENYCTLKANTDGLTNCTLYKVALSNHPGPAKLYLNKDNSGDHRMFSVDGREYIEIDAMCLDDFGAIPKAHFMKIDVQGSECRVLRGATKLIENSPHLQMLIEYSPNHLREAGASPGRLIAMLLDAGFLIYAKNGKGQWVYADSEHLFVHTKKHINLFCSHLRHEKIDWSDT